MKARTWLRIMSIPFLAAVVYTYYEFITLDILADRKFFFDVFPIPLTVIVLVLMSVYLLLGVYAGIIGILGKKLKKCYISLIWMMGVSQLYLIFTATRIGFGRFLEASDLIILAACMLCPIVYFVFVVKTADIHRR